MLLLGLHGDGVLAQGRMNQRTVDFVTLSLLASKTFASRRVPVICLATKYFAGQLTIKTCKQSLLGACKAWEKANTLQQATARQARQHWCKCDVTGIGIANGAALQLE